jgi:hypothetical protein
LLLQPQATRHCQAKWLRGLLARTRELVREGGKKRGGKRQSAAWAARLVKPGAASSGGRRRLCARPSVYRYTLVRL